MAWVNPWFTQPESCHTGMSKLQLFSAFSAHRRWLSVGIPVGLVLALTIAAFCFARDAEYGDIRGEFDQRAHLLAGNLTRSLDNRQEILHAIRSFYVSSDNVERNEFTTFTQRDYVRRPGVQSLEWVPRVAQKDRATFEQAASDEAWTGFQFKQWQPDGKWIATDEAWAEEYYPVYFIEPYNENSPRAGIDLGSHPALSKVLQQARDNDQLMALRQLIGEPNVANGNGFLLVTPMYGKGVKAEDIAARRENLKGFVLGRFNMDEIVQDALAGREEQDVKLQIADTSAAADEPLLFDEYGSSDSRRAPDLHRVTEYDIGGGKWRFEFTALPGYVASRRGWAPWLVLGGGLLLTVTLGGWLHTITGRAAKVQQLAEERAAALIKSAKELQLAADLEKTRKAELDFAYLAAGQRPDTEGEKSTILRQSDDEAAGIASFSDILDAWAWQARNLIGAHQSAVSYFPHGNIAEGIHAISLSDKYEKYRTYDVLPTGEGIWSVVIREKLSFCMTDEELQSHPAWKNFSDMLDDRGLEHPPMRGWLAVPVLGRNHQFTGLLQLSDKYQGDFTPDDLQRLERLARLMAPTFSLQFANEELQGRNKELADAKNALELSNFELQHFAYIASHDLQTPLRGIAAFAQFLQKDYEGRLDEQADDYIRRMVGGVKQMQKLITDLLTYSRVESQAAPFVAVDLNQVCDDVLALERAAIDNEGGQVTRDRLPSVVGDRSQLSQLLQNLIDNAVKYRGNDPPRVHVSAERDGQEWTFAVRDNGIGIDAKFHEQVFEVFRRLHTEKEYPGTGIGLAICRRIVQRHGGQMWLESAPGKGSTFYFTIPDRGDEGH